MPDCKTHGYRHLDEESYRNITNSPNLGVKIPTTGYNLQATSHICRNFAKQTEDCGFLDTSAMLNSKTQNEALMYVLQESDHKNLISGEIMINPEQNQFVLLDDVSVILSAVMGDKNDVLQKFVAPLTIYSSDKESHGVALCIEADRKNNAMNIMILEQHAKRDGGNLDFSKEVNATLEHLKNKFSETGMQITTFQNDKPICREKGVCSVVSLEVCRRLLQSDNPLHIAKVGLIKINAEQVQKLHQENFQNYKKEKKNKHLINVNTLVKNEHKTNNSK